MKSYITYPDIVPLLRFFRSAPQNSVGGLLHIFLEDGNVEDDHIKFCLDKCVEVGDPIGETICRLALRMSTTQRLRMSREFYEL